MPLPVHLSFYNTSPLSHILVCSLHIFSSSSSHIVFYICLIIWSLLIYPSLSDFFFSVQVLFVLLLMITTFPFLSPFICHFHYSRIFFLSPPYFFPGDSHILFIFVCILFLSHPLLADPYALSNENHSAHVFFFNYWKSIHLERHWLPAYITSNQCHLILTDTLLEEEFAVTDLSNVSLPYYFYFNTASAFHLFHQ